MPLGVAFVATIVALQTVARSSEKLKISLMYCHNCNVNNTLS
jgi:hypothetical protein